jgi:uncharacterized protein (TIGR01777 family)
MNILISGASGLIGTALSSQLRDAGHTVYPLSRRDTGQPFYWRPEKGIILFDDSIRLDAVINLAGENIAEGRWNKIRKKRIVDSRIDSTRLLSDKLASLAHRPDVFISGSAIGFYGSRGDEIMDETSSHGSGFLAEIGTAWEDATRAAEDAGIRTVHIRTGIVLSPRGGVLKKMLLPFRFGLGGIIGDGRQYMSWISIDDEVNAISFLLHNTELSGPFNLVAPAPVTNREFTRKLGKVLKRPTPFPMPAPVVRLMFGEMGDELLLSSTRVAPVRLEQAGYAFRHTDFEQALKDLISR